MLNRSRLYHLNSGGSKARPYSDRAFEMSDLTALLAVLPWARKSAHSCEVSVRQTVLVMVSMGAR